MRIELCPSTSLIVLSGTPWAISRLAAHGAACGATVDRCRGLAHDVGDLPEVVGVERVPIGVRKTRSWSRECWPVGSDQESLFALELAASQRVDGRHGQLHQAPRCLGFGLGQDEAGALQPLQAPLHGQGRSWPAGSMSGQVRPSSSARSRGFRFRW